MKTLLNKQIELPENELEVWSELAQPGTYSGADAEGKRHEQKLDAEAFGRLIANFGAEALVDYEHLSEKGDQTEAAGWIQELRIANSSGALEARIRFTDKGAEAVRARRLRFLSPVWSLGADGRPERLIGAGLTNKPNLRLRPILNKEAAPQGNNQNKPTKEEQTMKKLAALFGLEEAATEDQIAAAAEAAQKRLAELEARLAEVEAQALNTEAEKAAEEHKDLVANKEEFVKAYVANKAAALALLKVLKRPEPTTVTNKAAARPPSFAGGGATVLNKLEEYDSMPEGKEKRSFLRANAQEINTLRNKATPDAQ